MWFLRYVCPWSDIIGGALVKEARDVSICERCNCHYSRLILGGKIGEEKGIYFVVKNGTLQKKAQWFSADKTQKGFETILKDKIKDAIPGPGQYSPRELKASFDEYKKSRIKGPTFSTSNHKKVSSQFGPEKPSEDSTIKLTTAPSIQSNAQLLTIQKS